MIALSSYYTFAVTLGGTLAAMTAMLVWIARTSAVSIAWKVLAGIALASLACWVPFQVSWMLGYPVRTTMRDLPSTLQLVALRAADEHDKVFDLWVIAPRESSPRSYELTVDEGMKKALKEARESLARGEPVFLQRGDDANGAKGGGRRGTGQTKKLGTGESNTVTNFDDDQDRFHVIKGPEALPSKEQ